MELLTQLALLWPQLLTLAAIGVTISVLIGWARRQPESIEFIDSGDMTRTEIILTILVALGAGLFTAWLFWII
jgi:H+/Cl- antiporter ClcA